jgi:hypothetical protein
MTIFNLYRVFFLIDNNILKKEDARKALLKKEFITPADFGLIDTGLVKERYKIIISHVTQEHHYPPC